MKRDYSHTGLLQGETHWILSVDFRDARGTKDPYVCLTGDGQCAFKQVLTREAVGQRGEVFDGQLLPTDGGREPKLIQRVCDLLFSIRNSGGRGQGVDERLAPLFEGGAHDGVKQCFVSGPDRRLFIQVHRHNSAGHLRVRDK